MKKTAILLTLVILLFTGCSDLFTNLDDSLGKTGNSNVAKTTDPKDTTTTGLNDGLVVSTPRNTGKDSAGKEYDKTNRIAFNPDTRSYDVNFDERDSKVEFSCKAADPNATVEYTVWQTHDEAGNPLAVPKKLNIPVEPPARKGAAPKIILDKYGYGKFKLVGKITADDPQFSSEYTVNITRTRRFPQSALSIMEITPSAGTQIDAAITPEPRITEKPDSFNEKDGAADTIQKISTDPADTTTGYTIHVNEDVDTLTFHTGAFGKATIEYELVDEAGDPVTDDAGSPVTGSLQVDYPETDAPYPVADMVIKPVKGGTSKLKIKVTTDGDTTSRDYTVTIIKPEENDVSLSSPFGIEKPASDAPGMTALLEDTNPAPAAGDDPDATYYTLRIDTEEMEGRKEITIANKTTHKYARVTYDIESVLINGTEKKDESACYVNNETGVLTQFPGEQTSVVKVKVTTTAQDGTREVRYVTITNQATSSALASGGLRLTSLEKESDSRATLTPLEPAFAPDEKLYEVDASAYVKGIQLNAESPENAVITFTGKTPQGEDITFTTVEEDGKSKAVKFDGTKGGTYFVHVKVAKRDGQGGTEPVRDYTVIINKARNPFVSLKEITATPNAGTGTLEALAPALNTNPDSQSGDYTLVYNTPAGEDTLLDLPFSVDTTHPGAAVSYEIVEPPASGAGYDSSNNKITDIPFGDVKVKVTVTSEDGTQTGQYYVTIKRRPDFGSGAAPALKSLDIKAANPDTSKTPKITGDKPEFKIIKTLASGDVSYNYEVNVNEDTDVLEMTAQAFDGADIKYKLYTDEDGTTPVSGGTSTPVTGTDKTKVGPVKGGVSWLHITVTDKDDENKKTTYKVKVTKPEDNDTTLASLTTSPGVDNPGVSALSPGDDPNNQNHTLNIDTEEMGADKTITITAKPSHKYATVSYEIVDEDSDGSPTVDANGKVSNFPDPVGTSSTVKVKITTTAKDGTTTQVRYVTITNQPMGLQSLDANTDVTGNPTAAGKAAAITKDLAPDFNVNQVLYTLSVNEHTNKVRIITAPEDDTRSVTGYNPAGESLTGSSPTIVEEAATKDYILDVPKAGNYTVDIHINKDGKDKIYTLVVTKEPSTDVSLSAINTTAQNGSTMTGPSPALDTSQANGSYEYTYKTPVGTVNLPFSVSPNCPQAHVVYSIDTSGGSSINSSTGEITKLPFGDTKVTATVIAEDGTTIGKHEVTIKRRPKTIAGHGLRTLNIAGLNLVQVDPDIDPDPQITLDKPFSLSRDVVPGDVPDKKDYQINVNEDVDTLEIEAAAFGDEPNLEIKYNLKDKDGALVKGPLTPTNNKITIYPIDGGDSWVEVIVKESATTSKTYKLKVIKPKDNLRSLKGLVTVPALNTANEVGPLTPALQKKWPQETWKAGGTAGEYVVNIAADTGKDLDSIDLKATPEHKYAKVEYYFGNTKLTPSNGKVTVDLPSYGDKKIKMLVTAKNNETEEHFIIFRKPTDTNIQLKSITIKSGEDENNLDRVHHNLPKDPLAVGTGFDFQDYYAPKDRTDYNLIRTEHTGAQVKIKTLDKDTKIEMLTITNNEASEVVNYSYTASDYTDIPADTKGEATFTITNLQSGKTIVTFQLTAEDNTTTGTFTVTFEKPHKNDALIRSASITVPAGKPGAIEEIKPAFSANPDNNAYVYVDAETEIVRITPTFMHNFGGTKGSILSGGGTVNPDTVGKVDDQANYWEVGTEAAPLEVGDNTFTFKTEAAEKADGDTAKPQETYTIKIFRPASGTENRLHSFGYQVEGSGETDFPSFDRDQDFSEDGHTYAASINWPAAGKTLSILADDIYDPSTVKLTIQDPDNTNIIEDHVIPQSTYKYELPLGAGQRYKAGLYTITATVENGNNTRVYKGTLRLLRSTVSSLHSLTVNAGYTQTGYGAQTPTPAFVVDSSETKNYSYTIPTLNRGYDKDITIEMTATHTGAEIVEGTPQLDGTDLDSGDYEWTGTGREKTLTIDKEGYAEGGNLTIGVKVNSEEAAAAGGDPDEHTTYTLTLNIPKLEDVTANSETLSGDWSNVEYHVGTKNSKKLAYRFGTLKANAGNPVNKGGLDILGSDDNGSTWLSSSENSHNPDHLGGWHFKVAAEGSEAWANLQNNGNPVDLLDVDSDSNNDLRLTITPKIQSAGDTLYVKITHKIENIGVNSISGVKVGACSDSTINNQDNSFYKTFYGMQMTKSGKTLGIYCLAGEEVDEVDTLWAGQGSNEDENVFTDDAKDKDNGSAIGGPDDNQGAAYSWNIGTLAAGESVEKSIRISVGSFKEASDE